MEKDLGTIKKVEVRKVWSNEASEFTPWLAEEENMAHLCRALGMELEVENTEVAVGPYSADILAKDTGSGRYVVIENQLGKTNHDHLGKSITYASVLDASTIVWIASEFTEEHRKSFDWLNDNTTDELSFFAVQLEVWKIDRSLPAVRFDVISKPADIIRQAAIAKSSGELTETRKLQLDFWTQVRNELVAGKVAPSYQTPRPQSWYDVALGKTGIYLSNISNTESKFIAVRLFIDGKFADKVLPLLMNDKLKIEEEIGAELHWDSAPDNRNKLIAVSRKADLTSREHWGEYVDWMVKMISAFRASFIPRIKRIDFSNSN